MACHLSSFESLQQKFGHIGTKALRCLPPETAHNFAAYFLKNQSSALKVPVKKLTKRFNLQTKLENIGTLEHPVALAAGFDKNAEMIPGLKSLGFSLLEVGAVTPKPQAGHEKPRLFRQVEQRTLINRMGFNNKGSGCIQSSLAAAGSLDRVGVNIGPNKTTPLDRAIGDYIYLLQNLKAQVAYFSVNLSSPNTASLKSLCNADFVAQLARQIKSDTDRCTKDIWVKLGPNLQRQDFQKIIAALQEYNYAGVILTNTYPVEKPHKGGLSGHSLLVASTRALEWAYEVHRGQLPMIGVGGIFSGLDVFEKIIRGASLVQIYTSLVYRGPFAVYEILEELIDVLQNKGFNSLEEARGTFYEA